MDPASSLYARKYGDPSRSAEFVSRDGSRIQVFKWDVDQTGEGVIIYATAGASEILGTEIQSCEFFVGLIPAVDDVAEALAEIALRGIGSKSIPSPGDTTTLAGPLWSGTSMQSMLFTDGSELIPSYTDALKRIDFIQLVPLHASELDFKMKFGEKALWEAFEAKTVPYWDSNRSPAF